jgi:hypothetical protein
MARCYKFSLLRVVASPPRDERLNVGLAVILEGSLDVRVLRSLGKLNALSLAFDSETVRSAADRLKDLDRSFSAPGDSDEIRLARLAELAPFEFSPIAHFYAQSPEAYEQQISFALKSFVEPEPAPKAAIRGKATKLAVSLRRAFRKDRILAQRGEDLGAHRVVPNVALAPGLVADFVLKNGAMHVIETVDASGDASTAIRAIKDIALSALTIEQARMSYGDNATIGRLVYHASAEAEALATSALLAAEHQRIELLNWASADDQRKLLTTISTLAIPVPRKGRGLHPVNASTQHRFEIN